MAIECFTSPKALRTIAHMISLIRMRAMSVAELSEAMCISHRNAGVFITFLRRNPSLHGPIHIEGWLKPLKSRAKSAPRYRFGDGEDAPTPTQIQRKAQVREPLSEEEQDRITDQRLRAAAIRKQAKYPIQRHWLIAALYGPAQGASA